MSEWISVEDRLPDNHISVLAWDGGDDPKIFFVYQGAWLNDELDEMTAVTHWMPLPEPPC